MSVHHESILEPSTLLEMIQHTLKIMTYMHCSPMWYTFVSTMCPHFEQDAIVSKIVKQRTSSQHIRCTRIPSVNQMASGLFGSHLSSANALGSLVRQLIPIPNLGASTSFRMVGSRNMNPRHRANHMSMRIIGARSTMKSMFEDTTSPIVMTVQAIA